MSAKRFSLPDFTLKKKLILIIMFLVLLQNIVLLIFANYQFSQKELKSSVEHIQNECHLLHNDLNAQYHNVILCSNELISTINQTQSYYFSNPANSYLKSAFNYNLHLFSFVDSVVYLTVNDKIVCAGTDREPDLSKIKDELLDYIPSTGVPQNQFLTIQKRTYLGTDSPVLTFSKRVININTGKTLGYLFLNTKAATISSLFDNLNQSYYIINSKQGIVVSNSGSTALCQADPDSYSFIYSAKTGSQVINIDKEKHMLTWTPTGFLDYILVNETPLENLRSTFAINMFLLVLILMLSTITIIFLISAFTRLITNPLEYLSERMQHVELGDLKVRSRLKQNDEIGDISNNFNNMVQELEKLTAQIKQDERQKRKYELSLMQAQINPHFFYNVLDLIYISCYQKQEKQAATVTKYLADYYRCVLSNGKELIPIREEFRMLQNYLLIQRYRYATILDFQIEAEPEAENYIIPKMTLQPLVENSLYHGIKEKTSPGIIKIISRVRTDHITLCVCDNGVGMEQAKLRGYVSSSEAENHFGLKSVYNRLFLYYNNKCKFRIFSQKDTGTAVVICIPKNWEEL